MTLDLDLRHSSRPAPDTAPLGALVIDDDPAVRALVRRFLERAGYEVAEASSGRMALAALRAGAPVECVVTDLKMEDGSGGWLLAHIGYEFPALVSRTVVISGDAGSTVAAHLAARWRCPVLPKPFTRAQLLATLKTQAMRG